MILKGQAFDLIGCSIHVTYYQVINNMHSISKVLPRFTETFANATELGMVKHYHFLRWVLHNLSPCSSHYVAETSIWGLVNIWLGLQIRHQFSLLIARKEAVQFVIGQGLEVTIPLMFD